MIHINDAERYMIQYFKYILTNYILYSIELLYFFTIELN